MLENNQQSEFDEPEIRLLKEWLPRIKGEDLAYIKGASKALLYVQENQILHDDDRLFCDKQISNSV